MNTKHSKYICINLLEHDWEVVIYVLRDPKVKKDIKAAHCKVIEEAQEVYADWKRRGEWSDQSCGICRKSQRRIDDWQNLLLSITET